MGKLDGKVAIVTGAARGLGRAYAKRLAGLGAKVAVADLNLRSYEEFEAEANDMTADTTVAEPRRMVSAPTPFRLGDDPTR
jgi:3-oxoacyl-[acyl-carrier protein] reductase